MRTLTFPAHSLKSVVVMSSYDFEFGNQYSSTARPNGLISQWNRFSHPNIAAATSGPPMPLNTDAWVIVSIF